MSLETIAAAARVRLRDFGQFFEVPFDGPAPTLRLPHPLVDPALLTVWEPETGAAITEGWALDARNGILKFKVPRTEGVGVSGYHYTWFLPEDLLYFASVSATFTLYGTERDIAGLSPVEEQITGLGAAVQALWSLAAELSTDIDVSTPEGMGIPASQRFAHVWSLLGLLQEEYKHQAAMLGIGLDRIEQFMLRRTSKTTNRLVPVFRPREWGDARWPERIYTQIDPHSQAGDEVVRSGVLDAYAATWEGW